jgi:HSP20 family molecular chaperone IbpA
MSRPIPALDPLGSRAERTGFIRTESIRVPPSNRPGASSGLSGEKEEPGITLWAGPKALFINAVFPGIDLEDLQITITGTRLVFSVALSPDAAAKTRRRKPPGAPMNFSHSVALPYRVDADRAEVRKENGLISIILKKDESPAHGGNARMESSIMNSMRRYFGDYGRSSDNRTEEGRILQSLDKYFEYIGGTPNIDSGGPR